MFATSIAVNECRSCANFQLAFKIHVLAMIVFDSKRFILLLVMVLSPLEKMRESRLSSLNEEKADFHVVESVIPSESHKSLDARCFASLLFPACPEYTFPSNLTSDPWRGGYAWRTISL